MRDPLISPPVKSISHLPIISLLILMHHIKHFPPYPRFHQPCLPFSQCPPLPLSTTFLPFTTTTTTTTPFQHIHSLESLLQSSQTHDQLKQIHTQSLHHPLLHLPFFTKLITLYSQHGNLHHATHIFNQLPTKDAFLYNVMLTQLASNGLHHQSLQLLHQMNLAGVLPNRYTFPILLTSCATHFSLHLHGNIHCSIIKTGFDLEISVSTALLGSYGKLGSIVDAWKVFDQMPQRDSTSYTAMIGACTDNGDACEALELFRELKEENLECGFVTLVSVLKACRGLSDDRLWKWVHCFSMKIGLGSDRFVCSCLILIYARSLQGLEDARKVFDFITERNVAVWNSMIFGYAQHGIELEAFWVFKEMVEEDARPNETTLIGLIKACAASEFGRKGELVHCYCMKIGFGFNLPFATSLIEYYCKSSCLDFARRLFDEIPRRNVVCWHVLLYGLVQNGHACEALNLFHCMHEENVVPDLGAIVSALLACARSGSLMLGKCIHAYMTRRFDRFGVVASTMLVDMYAKCGSLVYARACFERAATDERNLFGWSSMIGGYGKHGSAKEALRLFDEMVEAGVQPDGVTFISILSACSHAGLVNEGQLEFARMNDSFGIEIDSKHYACMVDLLGRAGRLKEAQDLMGLMPIEKSKSGFGALLGACRMHNAFDLAESVADRVLGSSVLEDDGLYKLLFNMYGSVGRWDEATKLRSEMAYRRLRKTPGCSFIEVKSTC